MTQVCTTCGFIHNCYCEAIPTIASDLCFTLLTHPNEFQRETNTGKLVARVIKQVNIREWQRKQPDPYCLPGSSVLTPVLVFPGQDSMPLTQWQTQHPSASNFIVLDGTWQEAKKMLNRSQWLQNLPKVHLEATQSSQYQLRRNQEVGNLCTFEVCTQMVRELESSDDANAMLTFFEQYLQWFQAERSGHALSSCSQ